MSVDRMDGPGFGLDGPRSLVVINVEGNRLTGMIEEVGIELGDVFRCCIPGEVLKRYGSSAERAVSDPAVRRDLHLQVVGIEAFGYSLSKLESGLDGFFTVSGEGLNDVVPPCLLRT